MKEGNCCVCGRTNHSHFRKIDGKCYCGVHANQIIKYGKITNPENRTIFSKNKYYIYNNIVLVECYKRTGEISRFFICDIDDLEIVKQHKWRVTTKHNGDYIVTGNQFSKVQYFHNLVMKNNSNYECDHINRDTLDNRKINLRIVSFSHQKINQSINSRNTSNFKGISFSKEKRKWIVDFQFEKKRIYFQPFSNLDEAAYVRYHMENNIYPEYRDKTNDDNYQKCINNISDNRKRELDELIKTKTNEFHRIPQAYVNNKENMMFINDEVIECKKN